MVFYAKKQQRVNSPLDDKKKLEKSIAATANCGKTEVEPELLLEIRELCRKSNANIEHACNIIMKNLKKKHSESRLSLVQLCNELFRRSSVFRDNLVLNFKEFVDLTTGIDVNNPLPPPGTVAERLKRDSIEFVFKWTKQYGKVYPGLQLSYDYLANTGKVNFAEVENKLKSEYHRKEEKRTKMENLKRERIRKVNGEMEESVEEIRSTLEQLKTCFSLLVPTFEDDETSQNFDEVSEDLGREHGMLQSGFSITVEMPDRNNIFEKNDDNAALIENLQDLYALLKNKYWAVVERWRLTLQQCEGDVTHVAKLKSDIDDVLIKYKEFGLELKERKGVPVQDSSESDSDFEEVEEKEGYEAEAVSTPVGSNKPCTSTKIRVTSMKEDDPQPSTSKQFFPEVSSDEEHGPAGKNKSVTAVFKVDHPSQIRPVDSYPDSENDARTSRVPDWQDPELLRQLEEKTGINLKMPEPRKKKLKRVRRKTKAKKKQSLTNLKALKNTPRNRLHKKLFKKSTLKRVASSLDAAGRVRL